MGGGWRMDPSACWLGVREGKSCGRTSTSLQSSRTLTQITSTWILFTVRRVKNTIRCSQNLFLKNRGLTFGAFCNKNAAMLELKVFPDYVLITCSATNICCLVTALKQVLWF